MSYYQFTRSGNGKPCIGVGGGGMTNSFIGRTVIDKHGDLKKAVFIKTTGHRANQLDQAIVEVEPGDIIVHMHGNYPITDDNTDAHLDAQEIREIVDKTNTAITEASPLMYEDIPEKVIRGLKIRHNRDGDYFCNADKQEA